MLARHNAYTIPKGGQIARTLSLALFAVDSVESWAAPQKLAHLLVAEPTYTDSMEAMHCPVRHRAVHIPNLCTKYKCPCKVINAHEHGSSMTQLHTIDVQTERVGSMMHNSACCKHAFLMYLCRESQLHQMGNMAETITAQCSRVSPPQTEYWYWQHCAKQGHQDVASVYSALEFCCSVCRQEEDRNSNSVG